MPRKLAAPPDLIADLRAALAARTAAAGNLLAVATDSGLDYATLHRFATKGKPCSLPVAAKLAAYLGLRLCVESAK